MLNWRLRQKINHRQIWKEHSVLVIPTRTYNNNYNRVCRCKTMRKTLLTQQEENTATEMLENTFTITIWKVPELQVKGRLQNCKWKVLSLEKKGNLRSSAEKSPSWNAGNGFDMGTHITTVQVKAQWRVCLSLK